MVKDCRARGWRALLTKGKIGRGDEPGNQQTVMSHKERQRIATIGRLYAKQLRIAIIFFVCAVAVPGELYARWFVDACLDPVTGTTLETAAVTNSEGYSLKVRRISDGTIWVTFSLPDNSLEVLDERRPVFRIDKHEPYDLDKARRLGLQAENFQAEPKWISWQVFHGRGNPPSWSALAKLMEGHSVVFRYYVSTGGQKETSFSLEGSKKAIKSILE